MGLLNVFKNLGGVVTNLVLILYKVPLALINNNNLKYHDHDLRNYYVFLTPFCLLGFIASLNYLINKKERMKTIMEQDDVNEEDNINEEDNESKIKESLTLLSQKNE